MFNFIPFLLILFIFDLSLHVYPLLRFPGKLVQLLILPVITRNMISKAAQKASVAHW